MNEASAKPEKSWRPKLVLASASPRRLALLQQIGVEPDALVPAEIDETPKKTELPRSLATRLALEKAVAAQKLVKARGGLDDAFIIAADTVVSVGRRILPKCELAAEAAQCLRLLSGRAHRVFTAVVLVTPKGARRQKLVKTRVRFKRLSSAEMEAYLASGEWRGKAGGYAIQGLAGAFVEDINGSYSAVVGLPLVDVHRMLTGDGFPVHIAWLNHV
ncbi:MAG: Maf-like protein [Hyphomicrobiales bacterium]|nr:Maf-like protein [Hyphomicrobiales bacterium]